MLSKEDTNDNLDFPVYSSESTNNGIIGYTDNPEFICNEETPVYITFGDHTRTLNIAEKSFSVLDNVKVLLPCTNNILALLFMIATWQKQIPNLGYSRHWKVAKDCVLALPTTANNEIDFDFMESFIRELEEERIRELSAYLTVSGLSDATLTEREKLALQNFDTLEWQEFRMGDLFDRVSTAKLPYKAANLPKEPTAENPLPCLTSSFMNQGLNYYAPKENATVLNHVISIPSNSDVYRAYYQSHDFTVLSDAYAVRWKWNDKEISAQQYLFMVACINQVTDLPIYSYKNKLGGWNVVQNKYIMLPVRDGAPDYAAMQDFISAVQKLVIKDVVKYAEDKINATKKVVKNKDEYKTNEDKSFLSVAESADYKGIPR